MIAKTILVLVASALVASQSVPSLGTDCANQCSGLQKVQSCTKGDQTDLGCICNVYQSVIPGSCESCLSQSDPTIQQDLNTFLGYCKSGVYNGITVTGISAPTGAPAATGGAATAATTGGATGTTASTTATASTTGSTSGKSAGSTNVAGMGFVGLVLAFGGALIAM